MLKDQLKQLKEIEDKHKQECETTIDQRSIDKNFDRQASTMFLIEHQDEEFTRGVDQIDECMSNVSVRQPDIDIEEQIIEQETDN